MPRFESQDFIYKVLKLEGFHIRPEVQSPAKEEMEGMSAASSGVLNGDGSAQCICSHR